MAHLYVDSDGVFASFLPHALSTLNFSCRKEMGSDDNMWKLLNVLPDFWLTMPQMPDAMRFYNAIKHLSPTVLTGCPKDDFERAAADKRIWWKEGFNHEDVITCLSKEKQLYIRNPGDILVDDTARNLRRWSEAGGVSIHFKNTDQALDDLHKLGMI